MSAGYEIGVLPAPARDVYSVARLNREVRVLLERGLGVLWVEGELSNFSQPPSGHWYFSLKDRDAQAPLEDHAHFTGEARDAVDVPQRRANFRIRGHQAP